MTHWYNRNNGTTPTEPSTASTSGETTKQGRPSERLPKRLEKRLSQEFDPIGASDRLTTKEAAALLRLAARTLERYRLQGIGPEYLKLGPGKRARVYYLRHVLEEWLLQRRHFSTAEYSSR